MPDGVFEVSILTPESELLCAEAKAVVLRSSDGDLTILDGHTPIVTDVVPADVRVDPAQGDPLHVAVHGGYLQVETATGLGDTDGRSTRVTLLAGVAELAGQIDVARAERAKDAAQARVEELRAAAGRAGARSEGQGAPGAGTGTEAQLSAWDVELAEAEAALRRAEVRLEVAGVTT
jgi:F-type H+-transporting ATPase subunit epsilon